MRTYEFTMSALLPDGKEEGAPGLQEDDDGTGRNSGSKRTIAPPPDRLYSLSGSHIGFHYDKLRVLDDCNFQLQSGDFLGIRGDSGKGKTTLLNIILGFIEAAEGDISFNGSVVDPPDLKRYWNRIAYVKQQPFIIHDTLLANITLGEESPDEGRLQTALALSGLDDLIKKLPRGIGSTISESGKNVSGGQRQRISLARALYKNADLIILDEPFSELDEASELRLLERFSQLAGEGKMIIMITHNKKSLDWCSRTLSLEPAVAEGNG
jgi:ABC-type bacteriocin/lantibiotic exporter with double-glycine peptidase domain